jgi:hypothetical protein
MIESYDDIKLMLKRVAMIVVAITAAISLTATLIGEYRLALAIIITAPAGYIALYFLAGDLRHTILEGGSIIFGVRFIFRLACFAILLYLVLVKFKLSVVGSLVGLSMSVFVMTAVVLANLLRDMKEN